MNDLSNYLNSEVFYELIYNFKKSNDNLDLNQIIGFFTSLNVKLYLAIKDINLINLFNIELLTVYSSKYSKQYMDDYNFNQDTNSLLDKYVKIKLNTNDPNIVKKYLYDSVAKNNWKFHAFNSTFYESIKNYGINPKINFTPQKEIDEINDIFIKYGISNIVGYQKINSENKVSYSTTPKVSYNYGLRSPEWFSYFVSGGMTGDNTTFIEKDYNSALNQLNTIMNNKNFSNIDKNIVLSFFNKYWDLYVRDSSPYLVIVKESDGLSFEQFKYLTRQDKNLLDFSFNELGINKQTDEIIDTSGALFIKMPEYSNIIKYINKKENDINKRTESSMILDSNNKLINIQTYFNSDLFWDLMQDLNVAKQDQWENSYKESYYNSRMEDAMQYIVEESLKFYLLLKDEKNVFELLNNFIKEIIPIVNTLNESEIYLKCDELILNNLYNILNINDKLEISEQDRLKCFEIIYNNVISNDFAFHAFNNAVYDSIKLNGIDPNFSFTDQEELNKINKIYNKYGIGTPFFMQSVNCVNQISYSSSPNVSYGYGVASPEWFANFCSKNKSDPNYSPFPNRDYYSALENISTTISNFSSEDKHQVIEFFNKNWNIYASKENIPILAIVPQKNEVLKNEKYNKFKKDISFYFEWYCLNRQCCDSHIDKLDTSQALFVSLPSYNKLMELAKQKYNCETYNK